MERLHEKDNRVKIIQMAKNFGAASCTSVRFFLFAKGDFCLLPWTMTCSTDRKRFPKMVKVFK